MTLLADKPRTETSRSRESRERIARWKQTAAELASRHPTWHLIRIAREIQRSRMGRKRGAVLTYSVSSIARHIRGAVTSSAPVHQAGN
jgi:hypothetical protein